MSDLSRLLDDVYAQSETDEVTQARAPDWSSEEALDEVFSSWVPGPTDDASGAQRAMVAEVVHEPAAEIVVDVTWLQHTEPAVADAVVAVRARWTPSDDDILPGRRARRRRR